MTKLSDEVRISMLNPPTGRVRVILDTDTFNEIEENLPLAFEITYKYFPDENVEVDDRRESNGMEDNFVEIVDFNKLENFTNNIGF